MITFSAKGVRRFGRQIGNPCVTRAWAADGGRVVQFVTWDHVHGQLDKRSGVVAEDGHLPSCFAEDGTLLVELEPFEDDGLWPATVFG